MREGVWGAEFMRVDGYVIESSTDQTCYHFRRKHWAGERRLEERVILTLRVNSIDTDKGRHPIPAPGAIPAPGKVFPGAAAFVLRRKTNDVDFRW